MLDGHVDHISRHSVEGWALNTDLVDGSVDVVILLDGAVISQVAANLPRPDVAVKKKLKVALCGFSAQIPEALDTAITYGIEVRFANTNKILPNGAREIPGLVEHDNSPNLAGSRKSWSCRR